MTVCVPEEMPEVCNNPDEVYDFGIEELAEEIDREFQAYGIPLDLN